MPPDGQLRHGNALCFASAGPRMFQRHQAALKKAGFEILEATPTFLQFWKNGTRFFNVKGPSGEIIEFNQIL
jgi:hypothetical protein